MLQDQYKYKQILVECGVSTTKQYYMKEFPWEEDVELDEDNKQEMVLDESVDICPFDTLVLSIFNGPHLHPSCVGPVFPSALRLSQKFNVQQHTTPIETDDGAWVISSWRRRSRAEILKTIQVR